MGVTRTFTKEEKRAVSRYAYQNPELEFEEIKEVFGYPERESTLRRWMEQFPYTSEGRLFPDLWHKKRYTPQDKAAAVDYLFSMPSVNIKDASRIIGISERTLGNWAREDPRYVSPMQHRKQYSEKQRSYACDYYFSHPGKSAAKIAEELGYVSQATLMNWLKKDPRWDPENTKHIKRYTQEEKDKAIDFVKSHPNMTGAEVIKRLGYPTDVGILRKWLGQDADPLLSPRNYYSFFDRIAIVELFEESKVPLDDFCLQHSLKPATLQNWIREFRRGGYVKLMRQSDLPKSPEEIVGDAPLSDREKDRKIAELEFELDVARSIIEVLKKEPGLNGGELSNKEKVQVIDSLRPYYPLARMLRYFGMAKSSYFYAKNAMKAPDKYLDIRPYVRRIFDENSHEFGYRRIWVKLRDDYEIFISEKIVRRIMREEEIRVKCKKVKKYNSYRGTVGKVADNILQRNFHADEPFAKVLTDITEFHLNGYKVYLSAMVDCFNGECIAYGIGPSPNMALVMGMVEQAAELIGGSKPIAHSDQGWHYQNKRYVDRLKELGWTQSMSKKGCSPDNAAMEGFFGILKRGFFYNHDFEGMSQEDFIDTLADWLDWYNTKRIKMGLGGMSPQNYRFAVTANVA